MFDFNSLRMAQIFGPPSQGPTFQTPGIMDTGIGMNFDPLARMRELYNPSNMAQERFNTLAQNVPNRADYERGTIGKIGAVLAGLGTGGPAGMWGGNPVGFKGNPGEALATTQGYLDMPFNRALNDWNVQANVARQAADDEQQNNVNNRILASQTVEAERRGHELDRLERRDTTAARQRDTALEQNQQKLDIAAGRAEVYRLKSLRPNWQFKTDNTGSIVAFNPQNPAETVNTGVKSATLPDADKLAIQLDNALTIEDTRNTNRLGQIAAQGDENRTTKTTAPAVAPRPATESTTTYTGPEGENLGKRTTTTGPIATPSTGQKFAPPRQDGKLLYRGPDGNNYWVPPDKVAEAEKAGMKRQ